MAPASPFELLAGLYPYDDILLELLDEGGNNSTAEGDDLSDALSSCRKGEGRHKIVSPEKKITKDTAFGYMLLLPATP